MNKPTQSKVLIVDDSETNRLLLQFTLEELGYLVDEVENGEKAVEAALEFEYVAVFMDINMPIMGGLEATQILNNLNYSSPIIACSAEENSEVIDQFIDTGFSAFVPKPIEPVEIINVLKTLDITSSVKSLELSAEHLNKIQQLTERFVGNLPAIIHKVESALNNNSSEDLKRSCHKLKGTASQFGFDKVTKISGDIESAINKSKFTIATDKAEFLLFELKKISNAQQPK